MGWCSGDVACNIVRPRSPSGSNPVRLQYGELISRQALARPPENQLIWLSVARPARRLSRSRACCWRLCPQSFSSLANVVRPAMPRAPFPDAPSARSSQVVVVCSVMVGAQLHYLGRPSSGLWSEISSGAVSHPLGCRCTPRAAGSAHHPERRPTGSPPFGRLGVLRRLSWRKVQVAAAVAAGRVAEVFREAGRGLREAARPAARAGAARRAPTKARTPVAGARRLPGYQVTPKHLGGSSTRRCLP